MPRFTDCRRWKPDELKPRGKPLSAAVDVPKSKISNRLRRVLAAIGRVHGTGELPQIPVVIIVAKDSPGEFVFDAVTDRALRIEVDRKGPHIELTFAHEIGHFIEHAGIPRPGRSPRNFAADSLFERWFAATQESWAIRELARLNSASTIEMMPSRGRQDAEKVDRHYVEYLQTPYERWGRSYAQYIAARIANEKPAAQVDTERVRTPGRIYYPNQWDNDDFAPIAQTIDELFRKIGWRQ